MTKLSSRELLLWAGIALMSFALAYSMTQDPHDHSDQLNLPAPAISLLDETGNTVTLNDYQGKTVVLNVYANWCPPCRAEIPELSEFYKDHKDKNVVLLGVLFESGPPEEALPASRKLGVDYPILLGNEAMIRAYGLHSYPTTLVIDPQGTLIARHENAITFSELKDLIEAKPVHHHEH